jgi:hypothetical protein
MLRSYYNYDCKTPALLWHKNVWHSCVNASQLIPSLYYEHNCHTASLCISYAVPITEHVSSTEVLYIIHSWQSSQSAKVISWNWHRLIIPTKSRLISVGTQSSNICSFFSPFQLRFPFLHVQLLIHPHIPEKPHKSLKDVIAKFKALRIKIFTRDSDYKQHHVQR